MSGTNDPHAKKRAEVATFLEAAINSEDGESYRNDHGLTRARENPDDVTDDQLLITDLLIQSREGDDFELSYSVWSKTTDPAILARVVRRCHDDGRALPEWARDATIATLHEAREPERERHDDGRERHLMRWSTVRRLLAAGATWSGDAVFQEAARELRDTPWAGSPDAIKRSYAVVNRESGTNL